MKKTSIKKMFFMVGYGIFITVLLALGSIFLLTLFPMFGVEARIVESGSMSPTIKTGSMVVVVPQESYQVGNIITFGTKRGVMPTTHRIVRTEVQEGVMYYQTKGDANENEDPRLIQATEVRGKVVLTIPYLGFIIDFARNPYGFVFLIGIPTGVVVLDELHTIFREIKKMKQNKKKIQAIVAQAQVNNYTIRLSRR